MSRTAVYKVSWVAIILGGFELSLLAIKACPYPTAAALVLVVAFLVPGRLQGFAWRPFFRGRKAQSVGNWNRAISEYIHFQGRLRARPGLKHLIWLSWGMYTRDIEAMTENNLGACHLNLGALERAEPHFHRALALDPKYPIPHFNLAVVKRIQKDALGSQEHAHRARALGYHHSGVDHAIRGLGEVLAAVEGRGAPTSASKLEA
jgi:tetratricopeptide (TPR) repeat protein